MRNFLFSGVLFILVFGCKEKSEVYPIPEGDFEVEAILSSITDVLNVVWSHPKNSTESINYKVYLGDKEVGQTNGNRISSEIQGNRFVNGRVEYFDQEGNLHQRVFLLDDLNYDLIYIQDPEFEGRLIELGIDKEKEINGSVNREDAINVENISCVNYGISSHIGIEAFSSLVEFGCGEGFISSLDLRKNEKLSLLRCAHNNIVELDLSKNLSLKRLFMQNNRELYSLDISKNDSLEYLSCSSAPKLEKICVSGVEKAKSNENWEIASHMEYVVCD